MDQEGRIYVAGHRGLVGSAICRRLEKQGHRNLIIRTHSELDLTRQEAVEAFFQKERPAPTTDWALTLVGGLYVGWMGGHLVALRQVTDGFKWLMLVLLVTWMADTGAYLVGSLWGKHKLSLRLSPGKTWEGTIGGWTTGVGTGALLAWLFGLHQQKPYHG